MNRKQIFLTVLPVFLVFAWQACFLLKAGAFPIRIVEKDALFYSEIAKCLVETGQENNFTTSNLADEVFRFPAPYHYFDLWLSGFISKIFSIPYFISLPLIVYSFFTSILLFGLLAFIEKFRKPGAIEILLVVLLLFVGGMHINNHVKGISNYCSEMENIMEVFGGKLAIMYSFVLAGTMLFLERNNFTALMIFLCIPVISISTCPGILGGISTFILISLFRKGNNKIIFLRYLFYFLFTGFLYISFYGIFKASNLNYRVDQPLMSFTDLSEFSFFRVKFYLVELFLKTWAQPFVFSLNYLPFMLPLLFLLFKTKFKGEFKTLILVLSLIWFFSLLSFNTFYLMEDAQQLFTNNLIFFSVLFSVGFIFLFYTETAKSIVAKISLGIFFLGLLYNAILSWKSHFRKDAWDSDFSEEYVLKIGEIFDQMKEPAKGATFYDSAFYNNNQIIYAQEQYCLPPVLSTKYFTPFNLTPAEIPQKWNKIQIENYLQKSPFYLFRNRLPKKVSGNLIYDQKKFIEKNKISYLVFSSGSDLAIIDSLKTDKIIEDKLSGQKFVLLKN